MGSNPYTLTFGKEPVNMIARYSQHQEIYDMFHNDSPAWLLYMITGVRGSGKTVFMSEIAKRFSSEEDWIVVELNPLSDLLHGLAANLYNEKRLYTIMKRAKINLSLFGMGVEIQNTLPIVDIEIAVRQMLENIHKHGKKVLVTIDEVTVNSTMKQFASAFQIYIRQDLPIFLIMTGLYENIHALQNEKNLTFLHRAPRIRLQPLNLHRIRDHYMETFGLKDDEAMEMASCTKGYPFAFQVLGYFTYEKKGDYRSAYRECRYYLEEFVYDKIWSELSPNDKTVLYGIARTKTKKVLDIREFLEMNTNSFSTYRDRLIKKGLIDGQEHGYIRFLLPFFDEYALERYNPGS